MEGYAKVAQLMVAQNEFAILRSFQALGMKNLLYMQAEIILLESDLKEIVQQDQQAPGRQSYNHDWWTLAVESAVHDSEQWQKVLEIRQKIDKYYDGLLKYKTITSLPPPSPYDLNFLRSWLERPTMGDFPLHGLDRNAWNTEFEQDLVALHFRQAADPFSRWFNHKLIPAYHHLVGRHFKTAVHKNVGAGLYKYEDSALKAIIRVITTDSRRRLGAIVVLSACFSLALAVMTKARKVEIFAATSAFAAVNVVYLTQGACAMAP